LGSRCCQWPRGVTHDVLAHPSNRRRCRVYAFRRGLGHGVEARCVGRRCARYSTRNRWLTVPCSVRTWCCCRCYRPRHCCGCSHWPTRRITRALTHADGIRVSGIACLYRCCRWRCQRCPRKLLSIRIHYTRWERVVRRIGTRTSQHHRPRLLNRWRHIQRRARWNRTRQSFG
jgi:hypothetical protein